MENISWDDFMRVELRVGTILEALEFPEAKKPAFKLRIDFGNLGMRWSSAQITKHYSVEDLPGRQVIAVLNFPIKQIANFISECLVIGFEDENDDIICLQ